MAASRTIGIAANQIAKEHGARIISTKRHAAKKVVLQDISADSILSTENRIWHRGL